MADLNEYLNKRGITAKQMDVAREQTQAVIDAYNLREARKASNLTQVELARAMGVSQNRVSRMENGDINAMSVDALRRYVEALGGHMTLMADLPTGRISIA
jgi:predicted XRE-type DNA-binding protein